MSKPCPRILELIKGQKYTCSAVIVKRKPLVTQYRELKAKYGMDKWVAVKKGACKELRELYDVYHSILPNRIKFHDQCEDSDDSVLYLGIESKF